jgi:DNA-binding IclR family transcriptional regulator
MAAIMPMEVGQRVPVGIGSGSLAILTALEDAEIERIVGSSKQ